MAEASRRAGRVLAAAWLVGCGGTDAARKAPPCAAFSCPVGTYADEYREVSESSEQYVNVVEGECRYACVAAQSCPDGWWPVITEACFSCASVSPSGEPMGGDCDADNWALWYEEPEPEPEDTRPRCRSTIDAVAELEEPDDTREQALDLGLLNGGVDVEGYLHITTDTYYCGDGDSTGRYGEVDWFRFQLNCVGDAQFKLRGTSSTPSLFVLQDGETVAAPAYEGEAMPQTEVSELTGDIEVSIACWDAPSTGYTLEITF